MLNKLLRFLLIFVVILGVGVYFLKRNSQFLPVNNLPEPIKSLLDKNLNEGKVLGVKVENIDTQNLKVDPDTLITTLKQGNKLANQVREFIQGAVKVDESKGSNLPDRAVKYATYVYCKQVVDEWEKGGNSRQLGVCSE